MLLDDILPNHKHYATAYPYSQPTQSFQVRFSFIGAENLYQCVKSSCQRQSQNFESGFQAFLKQVCAIIFLLTGLSQTFCFLGGHLCQSICVETPNCNVIKSIEMCSTCQGHLPGVWSVHYVEKIENTKDSSGNERIFGNEYKFLESFACWRYISKSILL